MASIHLQGILVDSVGEIDVGGVITFTHLTTTGETIASTQTELIIPPDGAYSIDVEYGQIRIDYTTRNTERFVANVIVNSASTATSLPELLSATTPVANPIIIQMQGLVADAVTAQVAAEAAEATVLAEKLTTVQLIANTTVFSADTVINSTGYTSSGDGGKGSWKQNGATGQAVSQSPAQLADALLNDGNGNQWALVHSNSINVDSLGAIGDGVADDSIIFSVGLNALSKKGVLAGAGKYLISNVVPPALDVTVDSMVLIVNSGVGILQNSSSSASCNIDSCSFTVSAGAVGCGLISTWDPSGKDGPTVKNCNFRLSGGSTGVRLSGIWSAQILDNYFVGTSRVSGDIAIDFLLGADLDTSVMNVNINGNVIILVEKGIVLPPRVGEDEF